MIRRNTSTIAVSWPSSRDLSLASRFFSSADSPFDPESNSHILTKARTTNTLMRTARELLSTLAALIASFSVTPQMAAKSASRITFCPRMVWMRD